MCHVFFVFFTQSEISLGVLWGKFHCKMQLSLHGEQHAFPIYTSFSEAECNAGDMKEGVRHNLKSMYIGRRLYYQKFALPGLTSLTVTLSLARG